jgi:putative peptidoglycan lipid II flippase
MLRFTFPYLFFVSLTALAGGVLNTYGKFAAPAFTPVILNVVLIASALWLAPQLAEPGMALAYGVFLAGAAQLVFQIPFLAKIHAVPRPRWRPAHAGARRVGKLMLPAIFGSSVAQINVLVGGIIASLLGVGKISYLYYSDRLMEFPLGLFGIALATVMLPTLSRQAANGELENFSRTLDWSMKLVVLVAVPAAIGLVLLAGPLFVTLFYGGIFTRLDVEMAAISLQAFALGLIGFSFVKILAPAFFAREDTRTPVKYGLVSLAVNLLLSVLLAWYLTRAGYVASHAGLALATSAAAIANAWLLYRGLRNRQLLTHSPGWGSFLLRILVANAVMTGVFLWLQRPLDWWIDAGMLARALQLGVVVAACVAAYLAVLAVCGLRLSQLKLSDHH